MYKKYFFIAALSILSIIAKFYLDKILPHVYTYPNITELVSSGNNRNDMIDLAGVLLGARRAAADVGWIQLLQYYGTPEVKCTHEYNHELYHEHLNGRGGEYRNLLRYALRIVRLEPHFYHVYLYAAGALGWNLSRTDEALQILQEGIKYNPKYWRFYLCISAIVYKQLKEYEKMIYVLEKVVKYPDCPNIIKSILANIYESLGEYKKCLSLWIEILNSGDYSYRNKAIAKISLMREKLKT
jgi:tetratricopeptide (TPR) repeat protein